MAEAEPFVWGAGGAQLTPASIAAQRKVAEALIAQGMDASPVRHWTQGLARVAQAALGTWDNYRADKAEQTNMAADKETIAKLLGGATQTASLQPTAEPAGTLVAPNPSSPVYQNAPVVPRPDPKAPTMVPVSGTEDSIPLPRRNPLGALSPEFRSKFADLRTAAGEQGAYFDAPEQGSLGNVRSPQQQAALYAQGRTAPGPIVTGTTQSNHITGRALDVVPNGTSEKQIGSVVSSLVASDPRFAGMRSGATFSNLYDPLHVELNKPQGNQVASLDPSAGVTAPSPAVASVSAAMAPQPAAGAPAPAAAVQTAPAPANAPSGLQGVNPALLHALTSPYSGEGVKKIAGLILQQQMSDKLQYQTDSEGNIIALDPHGRAAPKVVYQATPKPIAIPEGAKLWDPKTKSIIGSGGEKEPQSVQEYNYYKKTAPADQPLMDYATWSTAKARAGATNISNNVDMNSGQTYDKLLAEGLGKSHSALSNDVEGAQSRARDLAAMQGAVDTIQKNGGTTGGLGQAQVQDLKKTLNAGASALGITTPFNENDISDKEFLQKFNRQMAGAQAKGAVGSRVTNFEMANYLKANPGLDMSLTGNQRLIGIQAQIEQRNIAVGNQIRQATAQAIAKGQKIDPVTVQKIVTDYDEAHHVNDPVNGQDLTQSYTLPEFQTRGTNPGMAVGHEQNIDGIKIKRVR